MSLAVVEREGLPVFPLPKVVLLPGEELALHVFEPRYRALVAWCRLHRAPFGVATLAGGEDERGRPRLYPEVGVGMIVGHRALPDGRSDIVVGHVATAIVTEEIVTPGEPFRRVRCAWKVPVPPSSYPDLGEVRALAVQVGMLVSVPVKQAPWWDAVGEAWLHRAASLFLTEPGARRAYLAADDGGERVALVREALVGLVESVVPALED